VHKKKIEIDDENRLRVFMDKRMAEEIQGDALGDEFKGYVFKIMGGNDKEGFPMRQGVLVNKRVKLLLRRGMPCYRAKRKGERKRKAVRGCIVGPDLAVLSLVIVKRGEQDLPGLTDVEIAKRLGPKRVDKIKKMFNLTKDDDPRDYVVRRHVKTKNGNHITKKPKIQRLITPTIRHRRKSLKKRVANRKKASFEKRKAFFDKITKKQQVVKKAKAKAQAVVQGGSTSSKKQTEQKPKSQSKKGGKQTN